jgi:hypothetical protein
VPDFRFDEATHTYTLDGVRLPSVSEIIRPCVGDLDAIPHAVLNRKRDLGKDVHQLTHLIDHGLIAPSDVDDERLRGYTDAYFRFLDDKQPTWQVIEKPLYSAARRYAGTPDRFGLVADAMTSVDIKNTYALRPATGVQLSGYALLLEALFGKPERHLALQLKPDGTYVLKEYGDETAIFLSLLNIHHWRVKHGIAG